MADYLTMLEVKGRIAGLKVAYIGDGNNVAHSLMFAGAQLGANVWIATPPHYEPNLDAVSWTRLRCTRNRKAAVTLTHDPEAAVFGADVVYTDVWASMGQESEARKRAEAFRPTKSTMRCSIRRSTTLSSCIVSRRIAAMRSPTR